MTAVALGLITVEELVQILIGCGAVVVVLGGGAFLVNGIKVFVMD